MHRRPAHIIALLAILAFVTTLPVAAQTPVAPPSSLPEPGELAGIQHAVVRTWGINFAAILEATPDYQPDILSDDLTILGGFILEFDTPPRAAYAVDQFRDGIAGELATMDVAGNSPIIEEELDDTGDQAFSATLVTTTDEYEAAVRYVLVQDGAYFFLTMAIANSEEYAVAANQLATWLADRPEPPSDVVAFDETGFSTGGLWEFFPGNNHEMLDGLIPFSDEVLCPPTGE